MDTLFLTFANQQDNPLPTLRQEEDAIARILSPRAAQQHFLLHRDGFATLDKLPAYLTLYRNDLVLFSFSGHAGRDRLLLEDGAAHGEGLAQLLGQCPKLKLVLLNGCSTAGQVARLQAAGVPVVIATDAPINDAKAAFFAEAFFEALQQQFSIREAFDMAKGAVNLKYVEVPWHAQREIAFEEDAAEGVWGLFWKPQTEHVLDWKLPVQPFVPTVLANFTPNQHLIDVLFDALAPYNEEVALWHKKAKRGETVPLAKKRLSVLNALPAPLAEPLRKLMVPVEDENEGYDKISAARLRQIVAAFNTSMELLVFTLMAQLWEAFDTTKGQLTIHAPLRQALQTFFGLSKPTREVYDLLELVRLFTKAFEANKLPYFVEELDELRHLVELDPRFDESLRFLSGLRLQVRNNQLNTAELAYVSKQGEECLTYLYSKLGFLARYKLVAIQGIDVQKLRHERDKTKFDHKTVMLHDLLGGLEHSKLVIENALDNRAILLLNLDTWHYLNLSPFVLDENAYQDRAEICKVYFFSHYLPQAHTWCYKYVYKPDDPLWEVTAEHPFVKPQFDAFSNSILHETPLAP